MTNVDLWQRFRTVSAVRWVSHSQTGIGWRGSGTGIVNVSEPAPDVLLFEESGMWQQDGGKALRFTNTFRWSRVEDRLRLDHLRFGADRPVFLFEMAADTDGMWREIHSHQCGEDCYHASLRLEKDEIRMHWQVRGPKHNELIEYTYR